MLFTDKAVKRIPLPGHGGPVQILLHDQQDVVTSVGQTHLKFYNFKNPDKAVEKKVQWKECTNSDCNYNITLVHQRKRADQVFVCGTNGIETSCCNMTLSEQSPMCMPSNKMREITEGIKMFQIKEGEQYVLVESEQNADLYVTYSGSNEHVGIHKFGLNGVRPTQHGREEYYVGLVASRRENGQGRVYAFYRQKNEDPALCSEMWLPFVAQVCMSDMGGPKTNLQFSWTSRLNAKLFCGDTGSKQHFSELVDVSTVHAERWEDTTVYALFRNEWGISAVCVYTIRDINNIFETSSFKGSQKNRNRECVADSRKIPSDTLAMIQETSEMERRVQPKHNSAPMIFKHHYTHIEVDSVSSQHTVMFLSLNNGKVHKVMQNESHTFVIMEFIPFNDTEHVFNIKLHPQSRKLYVNSRSELVQLDVGNCAQYGNLCGDCVLSRDPYCSWNGTHCTRGTQNKEDEMARGDLAACSTKTPSSKAEFRYVRSHPQADENVITVPSQSKYFLQCNMSSRYAKYTWHHGLSSTSCSSREMQCLFLIDSMGPEHVGTYRCESEEMDYRKVLATYRLQLGNRAVGQLSLPVVWLSLMVVLVSSLSCW
ncbi:semaphorin-7A isoform X2 [Parambassis ranga]|uniref:Semaphorin-7A isoform X2 n=1 Tax=Parambassis ranga TaxID=210632 RepID=A0A6P7ID39_9TELE|nr:semaphorin-7A-like isoform X2 [Parambassis ranga]